ncbi:hypothetical protein OIDMADRAFT_61463 [Oidiodendron maius Zn]|uniref:Uncharacterized protein n=1 Tax=Oidiodendron maius (strain Zn) TaxID=913774 RepID=A0A0C3GBH3_OIDMZ|nr:hypothetical protein OIDMADRAFT_61463 [Oidiodendron maius Zn]
MEHRFRYTTWPIGRCVLQEAELSFTTRLGMENDRFKMGYQQLWLYTIRYYPELPPVPKKAKKDTLAKARSVRANKVTLYKFTDLADQLGFKSPQINDLKKRSPDQEIASIALLIARRHDRYIYDEAMFEIHIQQIIGLFSTATPLPV